MKVELLLFDLTEFFVQPSFVTQNENSPTKV